LEFLLLLFCPAENVFNLFSLTELGGMKYMDVRRKIHDAVVCGVFRSGKIYFHPSDDEVLKETDKVCIFLDTGYYIEAR